MSDIVKEKLSDIIAETGRTREDIIIKNISAASRADILKRIVDCGIDVEHFETYKPSLNDIFVSLVGDEADNDTKRIILKEVRIDEKLGVVLQYEIMTYLKNKSYVISTVIIAVIAAAIMFVPRFLI